MLSIHGYISINKMNIISSKGSNKIVISNLFIDDKGFLKFIEERVKDFNLQSFIFLDEKNLKIKVEKEFTDLTTEYLKIENEKNNILNKKLFSISGLKNKILNIFNSNKDTSINKNVTQIAHGNNNIMSGGDIISEYSSDYKSTHYSNSIKSNHQEYIVSSRCLLNMDVDVYTDLDLYNNSSSDIEDEVDPFSIYITGMAKIKSIQFTNNNENKDRVLKITNDSMSNQSLDWIDSNVSQVFDTIVIVNIGIGNFNFENVRDIKTFSITASNIGNVKIKNVICDEFDLLKDGTGNISFNNIKGKSLTLRVTGVGNNKFDILQFDTLDLISLGVGNTKFKNIFVNTMNIVNEGVGSIKLYTGILDNLTIEENNISKVKLISINVNNKQYK